MEIFSMSRTLECCMAKLVTVSWSNICTNSMITGMGPTMELLHLGRQWMFINITFHTFLIQSKFLFENLL